MTDHPPRPDGIFTTWERTVRQEETVGVVTAENIGALAAWLKCTVDYSDHLPALCIDLDGRIRRVPVGAEVKPGVMRDGSPFLVNMNGFNRDNTWSPTNPLHEEPPR